MENVTRLRLLYLYRILEKHTDEKHPLPVSELIRILEEEYGIRTDRNALARDFRTLVDAGYPIEIKHAAKNLYYFTGRTFNNAELKLLIDAVASSKFIPEEESRSLILRLAGMADPRESEKLCSHVCVVGRIKSQNERGFENVDAINQAIEENRKITFQYFDDNTDKTKELRHNGEYYIVSPYVLVWDGDYYYLIGFNEARQKVEHFRLDGFRETCQMLDDERSEPPERFNLAAYLQRTFQMCEDSLRDFTI